MLLTCLAEFLNSPQLAAYLTSRGFRSIEDLSVAFVNKDRIMRLINKEKLIRFPYGGDIEGVLFEWRTKHQEPTTVSKT